VTNNTAKCAQLDMEMFWLSNPKLKMTKIFPRDLPEKVCIQFCCRGQECKRDSDTVCPFLHPPSSEDLKLETIKLIGYHFLAKKIGWFNNYHCLKIPGLKPKYKALLGDKDGPTSKTA
jgi:hypothetical protein